MANEGIMLILGLGALAFLGMGKPKPRVEETITRSGSGAPGMFPPEASAPFDIVGYVNSLFSQTASVPDQPPIQLFFPANQVVTSSGVPGITKPLPDIVTETTKVQIGGEGGETITESSLAIIRSEQVAKQEFAAATNSSLRTAPVGANYFYAATLEANRIAEAQQRAIADAAIAANKAAQARTRAQQEAVYSVVSARPPTINYDYDEVEAYGSLDVYSQPGQSITVSGVAPSVESGDVDFSSEGIGNEYVISGGMESPMVFAGEEEDTFSLSGVQDYGYGVYYGGAEDE